MKILKYLLKKLGNAQVNCERSGHVIWFKGNGKQEVLS